MRETDLASLNSHTVCFSPVVDKRSRSSVQKEYFETHSSLIFKWDCWVSHVCKSSAVDRRTLGTNLALWWEEVQLLRLVSCGTLEGDGIGSDSDLQCSLGSVLCMPLCLCEGGFLCNSFFKAPGIGRGGCVYGDAGDKQQIEKIWGIVNMSSLHMTVGKKSALILVVQ